MHQFSSILFHMNLVDSNGFFSCRGLYIHMTVPADRQIKLGDLIVLRVIRIKIIFSVKSAVLGDLTVGGKSHRHSIFHHLLI